MVNVAGDWIRMAPKDLRPYVRKALSIGWTCRQGKKHLVLNPPAESGITVCVAVPTNLSEMRGIKNKIADFRHAGIVLEEG